MNLTQYADDFYCLALKKNKISWVFRTGRFLTDKAGSDSNDKAQGTRQMVTIVIGNLVNIEHRTSNIEF